MHKDKTKGRLSWISKGGERREKNESALNNSENLICQHAVKDVKRNPLSILAYSARSYYIVLIFL